MNCPDCLVCHCFNRPLVPYTQEQIDRILRAAKDQLPQLFSPAVGEQLTLF